MRFCLCFIGCIFLSGHGLAQTEPSADVAAVKAVLGAQEKAWNRGDLEGFMRGYLPSERLVFIGKSGLTHGWRRTLANYREAYPDKDTMGQLTFDILVVRPMGPEHMLVIGKWRLDREMKDDAEGHFSLIWQKIDGQWLIIADHSS